MREPDEFHAAFEKIDAQGSPINYVAFRQGTVIPKGQSAAGASGHRNTWRIAYAIEPKWGKPAGEWPRLQAWSPFAPRRGITRI